jgi:flagellar biosynthetic protein FliR
MNDAALLAQLPSWASVFMLVLCRCGGVVMLMPAFAEAEVPPMIRAGLALATTLLLLPVLVAGAPRPPPAPGLLVGMIAMETAIGAVIGWLASLLVLALPIAGQILSYMMGLANVLQPDSVLGGQSTPVARLFGLLGTVLFMAGGLYAGPLTALGGSYDLFPLGGGHGWSPTTSSVADATTMAMAAVSGCFMLALRLAAPFILLGIVWQVALGLFSRLAPQLQIHSLAMPGQIVGGLALLSLLAAGLLHSWETAVIAGLGRLPGAG